MISFGNKDIDIIITKNLTTNFEILKSKINIIFAEDLENHGYDQNCKLNKTSNSGLWFQASNRFFYLYDYLKKTGIQNCFHIENDVMVYKNLDSIKPTQKKVYLTMDSNNRCIPGIVYISSYLEMEPLIRNYMFNFNDMVNLGKFYKNNKNVCTTFPIIKRNPLFNDSDNKKSFLYDSFDRFNVIFDAAAIGQYLGGCHFGVKVPGFINETCVVDYSKYKYEWVKIGANYVPHLVLGDNSKIPIVNLHIHRKELQQFMGNKPLETRLIKFENNSIKNSENKFKTHFISFGGGSKSFHGAVNRLKSQALSLNLFDSVIGFTEDDLKADKLFWDKHGKFIIENKRGYGYWIWKSYLVKKTLETLNEGDILMYADAGCVLADKHINELNKLFQAAKTDLIIASLTCNEENWTKHDLIKYLDMEQSPSIRTNQIQASAIIFYKCQKTIDLVNQWYHTATVQNYHFLDDSESIIENSSSF